MANVLQSVPTVYKNDKNVIKNIDEIKKTPYNNNKGGGDMFQERIMNLFEKQVILTNHEIRDALKIEQKQNAILNTEIKRLCDKDMVRRIGRGVYSIVWNTKWGKVVPTEVEIMNHFYIANNEGYMSGAAYYYAIGISTLVPNRKEITTNKYSFLLDKMANTDVVRPRREITKENKMYLQLLDGIYYLPKNHYDAPNPLEIFARQLQKLQLDEITLILMAKKLYPKFVLDMVLEIEEVYHNDEIALV